MNHDRPSHPCDLVGECNCRHLCRSAIHYSCEPRSLGAVPARVANDGHPYDNLLSQRTMMEEALSMLPVPVTFLRPGWFLENASGDVAPARATGVIDSFLTPLDKHFPMVATQDVGRVAAKLIQENWSGKRVVELEGPRRVSPNDLAAAFEKTLGTPVRAEIVPHEAWEDLFRSQGMKNPRPRIRMLDGFNEGWIDFHDRGAKAIKGRSQRRRGDCVTRPWRSGLIPPERSMDRITTGNRHRCLHRLSVAPLVKAVASSRYGIKEPIC